MDHVGTAAPAVRRPRCIGPQAFVFAFVILAEHVENENPPAQPMNLP